MSDVDQKFDDHISHDSKPNIDTYYGQIKDYAKHEDSLLNNRVNWLLLVSSFQFTGLALVTSQYTTIPLHLMVFGLKLPFYNVTIVSIGISGILMTASSYFGINAASRALKSLQNKWEKERTSYDNSKIYPDILGGGDPYADSEGMRYPIMLVCTMVAIWTIVTLAGFLVSVSV